MQTMFSRMKKQSLECKRHLDVGVERKTSKKCISAELFKLVANRIEDGIGFKGE